ncbi:hypothetical protein ACOMHN_009653 [Nucella lapillus]
MPDLFTPLPKLTPGVFFGESLMKFCCCCCSWFCALGGSSSSSLNSLFGGSLNDLLGPAPLGAPSGGAPGGSPGSMGTGAPMGDLTSSLTSLLGANSLNDLLLSPLG